MYNSDDTNFNSKKTKYSKSDFVKISMANYLQKRNYSNIQPTEITNQQLQIYSSIDNGISNPNSIGYRCHNCDPGIIDINFTKFLNWMKDSAKTGEKTPDLEELIGPLFCHLYINILQGGHPEKAAAFFYNHSKAVEKLITNTYITNLMKTLSENNSDCMKQEFRSNKYVLTLSEESKKKLMKFIEENCHLVFLQVLQTWFEIEIKNCDVAGNENDLVPNECCLKLKFQKILNAASELQNENQLIYTIDVSNVISEINCGVLSRYHGLFAYNQGNVLRVDSIHPMNSLSCFKFETSVKLNGHSTKIYATTISKHYLATASYDGKICIYEIDEFNPVKACEGHNKTVYCIKISSNELYLASGSEDNTVKLWNIATGRFLRIFIGHEQAVTCLDFHPNCLYLVSGSCDKNVRMWNLENGNSLRLFHASQGTVRAVAFHPLGKYLISGGDDRYLRLWNVLTGKIVLELKCREAYIYKIQWSKDGNLLCATLLDKTVKIWNCKNFENTKSLEVLQSVTCPGAILSLEYCFGTFGVLTSKSIQQ